MKPLYLFLGCFFLLCTATASDLTDQTWYEIKTPHFVIISNASEKHARDAAQQLEEFRAVFERGFPSLRMSAGAPTVVLAVKDESSMRELAPWFWEHGMNRVSGVFLSRWETSYALVRLDASDSYHEVFHEYVHQLQRLNFVSLPVWLREGMAEYYSTSDIQPNEVKLGLPSPWLRSLRGGRPPIPIRQLLAEKTSYGHGDLEAARFYAESWALTHMLIGGAGMGNGAKMDEFLHRLQGNATQLEVFQQVFGDPDKVGQQLQQYIQQFAFPALRMRNPPHVEESSIVSHPLKHEDAAVAFASFEMAAHRGKEAQHWLDVALHEKPGPSAAQRLLGFRSFSEGKDEEALNEFSSAFTQDPKDYLAGYYTAMLRHQLAKNGASADAELVQALKQLRAVNPSFAPVHVELSRVYTSLKQPDMALAAAQYAAQLEPGRAGYHLNVARILLQQGKTEEAAKLARFVAERWAGTDRDEALEIWRDTVAGKSQPASDGAAAKLEKLDVVSDAPQPSTETSGVIKSARCPKPGEFSWTVQVNDHAEEFVSPKGPLEIGFEDTLWYGDHFNVCHHVEGQRAVIYYKPDTPKDAPKQILRVRVCDQTSAM